MLEEEKIDDVRRVGRPAGGPPEARDCEIYERHILQGDTQQNIAAAFGLSQQRIAQVAARVEAWIAAHPEHPLAQRMRWRANRRWEAIWSRAIESFDRSREDRESKKERAPQKAAASEEPLTTITERTVRQQNGDPRFLTIAARAAEREDRIWRLRDDVGRPAEVADELRCGQNNRADGLGRPPHASRFPCLPAGLCDLESLAVGEATALTPALSRGEREKERPVSALFEQRCGEAFRYLGFEVRELGQGCGRVADCLAVATAERFAVIIDAKVRRRGYMLGTDDRKFCEYATRHTRELALSGIEKVYFAVIGCGFRQQDLDKLAGLMTGTPIRSVCFIEAAALMRIVNESIARRREFRLEQLDRLLFGNKIITEDVLERQTGGT